MRTHTRKRSLVRMHTLTPSITCMACVRHTTRVCTGGYSTYSRRDEKLNRHQRNEVKLCASRIDAVIGEFGKLQNAPNKWFTWKSDAVTFSPSAMHLMWVHRNECHQFICWQWVFKGCFKPLSTGQPSRRSFVLISNIFPRGKTPQ